MKTDFTITAHIRNYAQNVKKKNYELGLTTPCDTKLQKKIKKNRLQISHDDRVNDMHFGNQENEKWLDIQCEQIKDIIMVQLILGFFFL